MIVGLERLLVVRSAGFAVGWMALAASIACPGRSGATRAPDAALTAAAKAAPSHEVAEWLYDSGLQNGWRDEGTLVRELTGGPARVRFSSPGSWALVKPGLKGRFGGVRLRVREPPGEGEFLSVGLESGGGALPRVKIKPDHRTESRDGWTEVFVSMDELDADGLPFDRVSIQPFRLIGDDWVLFDKIALTRPDATPPAPIAPGVATAAPPGSTRFSIACGEKATKISPFIYGVGGGWDAQLGATAARWGGNATTRYNWQIHATNSAVDWFYENHASGSHVEFLDETAARHAAAALTVPIIGWVAKDTTSYAFPVSAFGAQSKTDPGRPDAGNGVEPSGLKIAPGPPTRTSVAAPPEWIKQWIADIRAADAKSGRRRVYEYILDNEPALWNTTQRDVHPEPVGYDELLERTIAYGRAIRAADPDALIAGPAEWGWSNYFYSAKDAVGNYRFSLDRRAHGDVPLIEWYLRRLAEQEKKTGVRVLDVVDVHYYPQEENVYGGGQGGTDDRTAALRLRATRSLWDPTYVDESWINQPIRLLSRMREWVDKNYPGRGISIGEWNFGGQGHITGALATAEALGRFAQFGVTSAFYWTYPPEGSPSRQGFVAYRNFDGAGGRFLDWYVPSAAPPDASLFVSRSEAGDHLVAVAINMSRDRTMDAQFDLGACGALASHQAFQYVRGAPGFAAGPRVEHTGAALDQPLPPWSITVLDIRLARPMPGAVER